KLATVEGLKPSVRKDWQVRILPPLPSAPAWPRAPLCSAPQRKRSAPCEGASLSTDRLRAAAPRERARPRRGTTPIESVAIDDAAAIISRCGECGSRRRRTRGRTGPDEARRARWIRHRWGGREEPVRQRALFATFRLTRFNREFYGEREGARNVERWAVHAGKKE